MKVFTQQLIEMIQKREIKNKTFFKDKYGRAYKFLINEYDLMEIKRVSNNQEMKVTDLIDNEFEVYLDEEVQNDTRKNNTRCKSE